ncbi:nucleoside hydrolase [Mesobacillus campisalis]|uniref:Nucleoside hydrolase n=1 Tax=Mesobacillus campisalis TaxID=1408103 RepID=A0A0M2SQ60_9BACI|nr:nucleoside hydrolase [Mesobacillus campisalis]KKK36694.1 nucleoside hydrolase [Mesobacillus campisalis]
MKKVLLFGDPGIDDAIAIIYALLNPQIDLVGVVTGYGNVDEKQATDNASYLLQLAGRPDIPVIRGARGPFTGELVTYYPEIHGPEGLGPIRPPENLVTNVQDYRTVFDLISTYKKELTIVDVGRSTSLATAFIIVGPEKVNQVDSIYLMGGNFLYPGNVTSVAEANFHGDPIATDLVLEKGRNITVVPLNVTNTAIISPETVNLISRYPYNPFSSLIKPIIEFYIDAYKKLIPGLNGAPMHDVLTLFALLNPQAFQSISRRVRVDASELSRGRTIADFRAKPEAQPPESLERILLQYDYNAFLADFVSTMTNRI